MEGNGASKLDRSIIYIYISRDYARFPGGLIDAPAPGNDEGRGNARQLRRKSSRHFPPPGIEKAFRAEIKIDHASTNRVSADFIHRFDFYSPPPLLLLLHLRFVFFSFSIVFFEQKEAGSAGARLSKRRGLKFVDPSRVERSERGRCADACACIRESSSSKMRRIPGSMEAGASSSSGSRLPSTFEPRGIHPLRERAASVPLVEDVVDRRRSF